MQREVAMRTTLFTAAAFLCVAVPPAFAQSYDPDITNGNITQWFDRWNNLHSNPSPNAPRPYGAYGEAPPYQSRPYVRPYRPPLFQGR